MAKSALQEILEGLEGNIGSFEVREYSGRGMYGRHCLAVVTGRDSLHSFEVGVHLGKAASDSGRFDEIEDSILDMKEDSMGLGSVMYWPRVPYVSDEEAAQEEDDS